MEATSSPAACGLDCLWFTCLTSAEHTAGGSLASRVRLVNMLWWWKKIAAATGPCAPRREAHGWLMESQRSADHGGLKAARQLHHWTPALASYGGQKFC